MIKNNWKTIVALGVVGVLLVYFITLFVISFGEQKANNQIKAANFNVLKQHESENADVGDVYMTLNWNEFADSVVIQVGNNASCHNTHLKKDYRLWYYIFDKTQDGSLKLNGVLAYRDNFTFGWGKNSVYELYLTEKDKTNKYKALTMLTHEFEYIFTGKIASGPYVSSFVNYVDAIPYPHVLGGNNGIVGDDFYFVKNAESYLPAKDSYRLYLQNADKYAPQLINEIYKTDVTEDSIFGVKEDYFLCYSYDQVKVSGEKSKGWVRFNMKVSVDYKDYT
ncbi:MAG: hypothetical protein IKT27_07185, partial [Clostridia bacterium]|nr:hypothetical protein [Clostridia bacterium]